MLLSVIASVIITIPCCRPVNQFIQKKKKPKAAIQLQIAQNIRKKKTNKETPYIVGNHHHRTDIVQVRVKTNNIKSQEFRNMFIKTMRGFI